MPWYRIQVEFAEPTPRDVVDDLAGLLDYPEVSEVDAVGQAFLLTLEADDPGQATASIDAVLLELAGAARNARQGVPVETTDPRVPSPRTLEILGVATEILVDQLADDLRALQAGSAVHETWTVSEYLPACFARHYGPELIEQWIRAVERVGGVLARYPNSYLASTAEELAGHAIISEAKGVAASYADEGRSPAHELAQVKDKLEEIHDLAFEDHDVLLLFDASLDGLEEGPLAEQMGFANLHPRDWFEPFDPARLAARGI